MQDTRKTELDELYKYGLKIIDLLDKTMQEKDSQVERTRLQAKQYLTRYQVMRQQIEKILENNPE